MIRKAQLIIAGTLVTATLAFAGQAILGGKRVKPIDTVTKKEISKKAFSYKRSKQTKIIHLCKNLNQCDIDLISKKIIQNRLRDSANLQKEETNDNSRTYSDKVRH